MIVTRIGGASIGRGQGVNVVAAQGAIRMAARMAFIAPPHKAAHQKRHFSVLRSTLHLIRAYNSPINHQYLPQTAPAQRVRAARLPPFRVTTCPGLLVTGRPRLMVAASRTGSFGFAPGDTNNMPLPSTLFFRAAGYAHCLRRGCLLRYAAARVRRSPMIRSHTAKIPSAACKSLASWPTVPAIVHGQFVATAARSPAPLLSLSTTYRGP